MANYIILGAGIIGLTIAREILIQKPTAKIIIFDKESNSIEHGSGRNSGVIHAGFYYSSDSLKAKFTAEGNRELTQYIKENGLKLNQCGKIVVAQQESDIDGIHELSRRAAVNGANVEVITASQVNEIEPNIKTIDIALYSPNTASANPAEVTSHIAQTLINKGVEIRYNTPYVKRISGNKIICGNSEVIEADLIINSAGLYADKIAKDFGFSEKYTIIPFKGIYLKYTNNDMPIKTNIYPVPNLENPFLGVHYTITANNEIKIGPTAIPAFWRENYYGLSKFKFAELIEILGYEAKLFMSNSFGFRDLALSEFKKYSKSHFISLAVNMVKKIDVNGFNKWTKPGIRAQLLNTETMELLQDFVIEADDKSVHILNAVSPAWTSSFPFARYIVNNYILKE